VDRFKVVERDFIALGQARSVMAVMLMILQHNPRLYYDTVEALKNGVKKDQPKEYIDGMGRKVKPTFNDKGEIVSMEVIK
jgi:hypothetical protein